MSTTDEGAPLAECGLAAWGVIRAPIEAIAALRKNPGTYRGAANPAAALKLADDQTVVAVAAVMRAAASAGWEDRTFHDWGVIAAPQYLGRIRSAALQHRFAKLHVRGMSPLHIPHSSLHSTAASISIALTIHGTSFGVGGAPGQVRDSLLTGLGLLLAGDISGLWVVMTQWATEPEPDRAGKCHVPLECVGVAMALVAADMTHAPSRLRLRPAALANSPEQTPDIVDLACHLSTDTGPSSSWFCRLAAGLSMEITGCADPQSGSMTDCPLNPQVRSMVS